MEIGDRTVIREYATINRGTAASGATIVGRDCFLMAYVHVAHDCRLGDGVTIANATQLAGHVTVEDGASLSGLIAVHQFVTIGTHAFVGGASRVPQDIPPYVKAVGNPVKLYGLNTIGLQRAGYSPEAISALKRAYRLLFNSSMPRSEALDALEADAAATPVVRRLVDFLSCARRGATGVSAPSRLGVIGVGALGWHHARHLAAMSGVELVGVYDIRPERAQEVAAALGTSAFSSREALLDRVEGAIVAVPTVSHLEVGLAALEAGVAVFLEKPMASTLTEADRLWPPRNPPGSSCRSGTSSDSTDRSRGPPSDRAPAVHRGRTAGAISAARHRCTGRIRPDDP